MPLAERGRTRLQHEGAPPHLGREIVAILNENYLDRSEEMGRRLGTLGHST